MGCYHNPVLVDYHFKNLANFRYFSPTDMRTGFPL